MTEARDPDEPVRLHSAGGVVVQGEGDTLRVAVMRSGYGTWVFPKGGLRPGEDAEAAARREVEEEVGLAGLALLAPLGETEHEFAQGGWRYRKRVAWFLYQAPEGAEPRADPTENALDCEWFSPEAARSLLSHDDQRRMLRRALSLLRGAREQAGGV